MHKVGKEQKKTMVQKKKKHVNIYLLLLLLFNVIVCRHFISMSTYI